MIFRLCLELYFGSTFKWKSFSSKSQDLQRRGKYPRGTGDLRLNGTLLKLAEEFLRKNAKLYKVHLKLKKLKVPLSPVTFSGERRL